MMSEDFMLSEDTCCALVLLRSLLYAFAYFLFVSVGLKGLCSSNFSKAIVLIFNCILAVLRLAD